MADPRVVVYSRHGCHLCEEAVPTVAAVCAEVGEAWTVVDIDIDIDADAALRSLYSDDVPVVVVDGAPVSRWFVDEVALRRALA